MTIPKIEKMNRQFQENALGLFDMIPRADVAEYSTMVKRKAAHIHGVFLNLITNREKSSFWNFPSAMEESMDELVYDLDRLHDLNCLMKIKAIEEFIKSGYDLLSVYSMGYDQLMKQKTDTEKTL